MTKILLYGLSMLTLIVQKTNAQDADSNKVERFSIHAQTTVINQYKFAYSAPYSGSNSLRTSDESQTSLTSTLYFGARLWKGASAFINPEIAGGSGLSGALGIAAATNGETFRIGDPSPKTYVARVFFRQVFELRASKHEKLTHYFHNHSDFNQLEENVPTNYFAITAGKVSISDYFDDNSFSHDPRTQFMSWGLMSNGAWDYPANTRGYTPSIVLEYADPKNEIRYGYSMVPATANDNIMDNNLNKAGAHTIEYTLKFKHKEQKGAIRLLAYYNLANMGSYQQGIISGDISLSRSYQNHKYGFCLNSEYEFSKQIAWFMRAGWNDGENETWCFTEIDQSFSTGVLIKGYSWKREEDNIGLAIAVSGLSQMHRNYLNAGGSGFMLGDGKLNYANEKLLECFYSKEMVADRMYLTGTYQFLLNPGYNADRKGPVNIISARVHFRF